MGKHSGAGVLLSNVIVFMQDSGIRTLALSQCPVLQLSQPRVSEPKLRDVKFSRGGLQDLSLTPIAFYLLSTFSHCLSTSISLLLGTAALELLAAPSAVSVVCQEK